MNSEFAKCNKCGKYIFQKSNNPDCKGSVIKSKLVFLNEDGSILCKCPYCKEISPIPLKYSNSKKEIISTTVTPDS